MLNIETAIADKMKQVLPSVLDRAYNTLMKENRRNLVSSWMANGTLLVDYALKMRTRFLKSKTFIYRDAPVFIEEFYVRTNLSLNTAAKTEILSEVALVKEIADGGAALIIGQAGSGKTLVMKYMYLEFLTRHCRKLPVFFEFRSFKGEAFSNLLEILVQHVVANIPFLNKHDAVYLIQSGLVALFLDGLDELAPTQRMEVAQQLARLIEEYPNNTYFISSRPDGRISTLGNFNTYQVCPMNLQSARKVIEKIDCSSEDKRGFLKTLTAKFFGKYERFLSNPLMLTIMFLTFQARQSIPENLTSFYLQAYEALYYRHDTTSKVAFIRDSESGLSEEDFKKAFAFTCFLGYLKNMYQFDKSSILMVIESVLQKLQLSVAGFSLQQLAVAFLNDLTTTYSLMFWDGDELHYPHRSFQEFFCAFFISRYRYLNYFKSVQALLDRALVDSVFEMLEYVDAPLFERDWVYASLNDLASRNLFESWSGREDEVVNELVEGVIIVTPNFPASTRVNKSAANRPAIARVLHSFRLTELGVSVFLHSSRELGRNGGSSGAKTAAVEKIKHGMFWPEEENAIKLLIADVMVNGKDSKKGGTAVIETVLDHLSQLDQLDNAKPFSARFHSSILRRFSKEDIWWLSQSGIIKGLRSQIETTKRLHRKRESAIRPHKDPLLDDLT